MFLCFISEKKHSICLVLKKKHLTLLFGLSAIPFFNKFRLSAILQVDWLPGYKLLSSSSSWTYSSINLTPSWLLTAYASKEQSPPWMLLNKTYQASLQQWLVNLSFGAILPELIFNNPHPPPPAKKKKKLPFFYFTMVSSSWPCKAFSWPCKTPTSASYSHHQYLKPFLIRIFLERTKQLVPTVPT